MRVRLVQVLTVGLLLAACAADKDAFYPETASADRVLEQRALARLPAPYRPVSVTVIRQWGPLGGPGGDTDIVGYNAWIRVAGCKGHVLVRFDRAGGHRGTADLTRCD
ncbi:MAG: hypothetical protein RLO51_01840 [Thalassobaculum sp.]|uniref:hypothetical protein n=1 Tax=Thalassobaculum sp. TaxID=2022740 RepID=UPI0032ED7A8A